MDLDFNRFLKISPMWWGAIASAVAAGAFLVPGKKIVAGAVAGGAMLVLAYYNTPCCSLCADATAAANAGVATVPTNTAQPAPVVMDAAVSKMMNAPSTYQSGASSPPGTARCFS